jgi:hypothetical protein
MVEKNPKEYKGKYLVYVYFKPYFKDDPKGMFMTADTWIDCNISIFPVINNKLDMKPYGCNWTWRTDDFKLSKFSFDLIHFLIKIIKRKIYSCGQLSGEPLSFMIKYIKKEGVKFKPGLLEPLEGL